MPARKCSLSVLKRRCSQGQTAERGREAVAREQGDCGSRKPIAGEKQVVHRHSGMAAGSAERRLASALPADPPPMMMKSYCACAMTAHYLRTGAEAARPPWHRVSGGYR